MYVCRATLLFGCVNKKLCRLQSFNLPSPALEDGVSVEQHAGFFSHNLLDDIYNKYLLFGVDFYSFGNTFNQFELINAGSCAKTLGNVCCLLYRL